MGLPLGIYNERYGQDMAVCRTRLQWALLLGLLMIIFCVPLFASLQTVTLLTTIGIILIAVEGLNILTGYCGQISLGQSAFMAVGAYTSAIVWNEFELSFWAALPLSALVSGLVGVIFGLPATRVKGFYLVLSTIAAQFIILWLVYILPEITGGTYGLPVPRPTLGGIQFSSRENFYILVMGFVVVMTFIAKNLARTKVGRAFVAIRDDDLAAEVMGIDVPRYKLLAFFICSVYAGVAGFLWAHFTMRANIDQFTLMDSIWYVGMLIVGGMGSTAGAIFGTTGMMLLDHGCTSAAPVIGEAFPAIAGQISSALGRIAQALVIIVFLILEPRGLAHRWEMTKASYRMWPFSY